MWKVYKDPIRTNVKEIPFKGCKPQEVIEKCFQGKKGRFLWMLNEKDS